MPTIDTENFSAALRRRSVNPETSRVLLTDLRGSEQEADLTLRPNCEGLGRIRHFRRETATGWPPNPLPIDPATHVLGLPRTEILRAQAFQLASCNWRCWYCYVPFELLSANPAHARWVTAGEMIDLYLAEPDPPRVIDLTGGQPDLVPEWTLWTMDALTERGLQDHVYLWSDDNLSNDFLWKFLSEQQLERISTYRNYGRVACFKGYDADSFAFNTSAAPELFNQQFLLMRRLLELELDLYAYTTFTTPTARSVTEAMPRFVDRLQEIHESLPLRTVPLQIQVFTPAHGRVGPSQAAALVNQQRAIEQWNREIEARFSADARATPVHQVRIRSS